MSQPDYTLDSLRVGDTGLVKADGKTIAARITHIGYAHVTVLTDENEQHSVRVCWDINAHDNNEFYPDGYRIL